MRILFEEYNYDTCDVKDILGNLVLSGLDMAKSSQQLRYVGYFFNKDIVNHDGSKGDLVFILPKVLLDKNPNDNSLKVFGLSPKDIINFNPEDWKKEDLVVEGGRLTRKQVYDFIYGFAIWIYRALAIYDRNVDKDNNETQIMSSVKVGQGGQKKEVTFVDIMLSLLDFQRTHRNFILFVMKMAHSGFHKVSWPKTIARTQPVMQDGVPIYMNPINKKRTIDFDEELLVIYYSILNYMHDEYGFPLPAQPGYELIKGAKFKGYLDGRGKTRLHQIRYKYYSDDAVLLWNLCYDFFDKSSELKGQANRDDYLLVNKFETVFEGMIDELIGDKDLPEGLKVGADDKRIDHLYTYKYLLENMETVDEANKTHDIYHIADSKYYRRDKELHGHDVPKQFTYARNVVQWHMDLLHDLLDDDVDRAEAYEEIPMFDEVTEGYNIIPNFFISALVDEELSYDNADFKKTNLGDVEGKGNPHESYFFWERLFDRSTYFTLHYDVNFLFVMKKYAQNRSTEKAAWREEVRKKFREGILEYLNEHFDFYQVAISESEMNGFIEKYYRKIQGKVFSFVDSQNHRVMLYAERKQQDQGKGKSFGYNSRNDAHVINGNMLLIPLKDETAFYDVMKKKLAGENVVYDSFEKRQNVIATRNLFDESGKPSMVAEPVQMLEPSFNIASHANEVFMIGCFRDSEHYDWIKENRKYNIRLGEYRGAVGIGDKNIGDAKYLLLYDKNNLSECHLFALGHVKWFADKKGMEDVHYPKPRHNEYLLYGLSEVPRTITIDLKVILKKNNKNPGQLFYLTGEQILESLK